MKILLVDFYKLKSKMLSEIVPISDFWFPKSDCRKSSWSKRLGQVSKYHLKIQKKQKQWIRKISSQWHFKI